MSLSSAYFYLPGAGSVSHTCLGILGESRLTFEGVQETPSAKPGIRCHNFITSFFLRCFGLIVDVKDIDGKVYHLNRGSLTDWLIAHHDHLKGYKKETVGIEHEGLDSVSENALVGMVRDVLTQRSPAHFVTLQKLKSELGGQEEEHERATRNQWNRACDFARPAEMAGLRAQIAAVLQAERLRR